MTSQRTPLLPIQPHDGTSSTTLSFWDKMFLQTSQPMEAIGQQDFYSVFQQVLKNFQSKISELAPENYNNNKELVNACARVFLWSKELGRHNEHNYNATVTSYQYINRLNIVKDALFKKYDHLWNVFGPMDHWFKRWAQYSGSDKRRKYQKNLSMLLVLAFIPVIIGSIQLNIPEAQTVIFSLLAMTLPLVNYWGFSHIKKQRFAFNQDAYEICEKDQDRAIQLAKELELPLRDIPLQISLDEGIAQAHFSPLIKDYKEVTTLPSYARVPLTAAPTPAALLAASMPIAAAVASPSSPPAPEDWEELNTQEEQSDNQTLRI